MAMGEGMFRKAALEKLSSPEQLDVMMQVTSPMGWIAMAGTGVILGFVIVWSVVGEIGIRVDGQGILLRGGATQDVSSGTPGRIEEFTVKPGDMVTKGQVIARISQPDLQLRISNKKSEIAQLESAKVIVGGGSAAAVGPLLRQKAEIQGRMAKLKPSIDKGLIPASRMYELQQQLLGVEAQIGAMQSGDVASGKGREIQIDNARRELKELESQLGRSTVITSPHPGRVVEVTVSSGSLVQAGARLLTLEQPEAQLQTNLYIEPKEGKKIRPGMTVRISPSTIKVEEYGFLVGKVKTVSDFPVTRDALNRVLHNDALVETFMGKSAPIEVVAELTPDKTTPSGYKWSSSKGPPSQIQSGTVASGSVIVENKKPISYVIPIVKKAMGSS